VYITEAHSADEWPVGETISFCDQPKTLEERCSLARKYVVERKLKVPMLVDDVCNTFENEFAAWPFRFYIFVDDKLELKAQPNTIDYSYDLEEIRTWLLKYFSC